MVNAIQIPQGQFLGDVGEELQISAGPLVFLIINLVVSFKTIVIITLV